MFSRYTCAFIATGMILLTSCNNGNSNGTTNNNDESGKETISTRLPFDSTEGRLWLVAAIEHSFRKNNGQWEPVSTDRYNALLEDCVELYTAEMTADGGYDKLAEKYHAKWAPQYAVMDSHFLYFEGWIICGQDWDENKFAVKESNYLMHDASSIWYRIDTRLGDESGGGPETCPKDIRVVKEKNGFKIDYVRSYF